MSQPKKSENLNLSRPHKTRSKTLVSERPWLKLIMPVIFRKTQAKKAAAAVAMNAAAVLSGAAVALGAAAACQF